MCAIAGIFSLKEKPINPDILKTIGEAIAHRGPDGSGQMVNGPVGLLNHRFALEDIEGGAQPVRRGQISLVFNGEIFNWRELARRHGVSEATGDTVLLARLFEKLGYDALEELDGQFALAAWDHEEKTLTLARDPAGILPIFYAQVGDEVIFSSELRGILAHPALSRTPDHEALAWFFRMGFFQAPATPFCEARQLEPGCAMIFSSEDSTHRRFFVPEYSSDYSGGKTRAGRELFALICSAGKRMISRSPQGLFLSGGVDSMMIAAALKEVGFLPPSFTVGFQGDQADYQAYHFTESFEGAREIENEFDAAELSAKAVGVPSPRRVCFRLEALMSRFAAIVGWLDLPSMSISAPPLYFLTEEAARTIRVAYSGGGADELFAGYAHVDPALYEGCAGTVSRYLQLTQIFSSEELVMIGSPHAGRSGDADEVLREAVARSARVEKEGLHFVLAAERLGPLPHNILQKNDRMGMRMPLEMRYPFLDGEVMRFAQRLPESLLVEGREGKILIKTALEEIGLSPELTRRKKVRLQAPYATILKDPAVREYFRSLIANPPENAPLSYLPDKADEFLFGPKAEGVWRRPAKILHLATWNLWAAENCR